jgi:8-oxo-dGTP pyrophosphatase MutT (NUDIX family)
MGMYGSKYIREGYINEDKTISTDNKKIEKVFGYTSDDGIYNALVKVKGIKGLLRGRSEMLILDESKTKVFIEIKKDGSYKIPGGSWNENEDHLACAIRETEEEVRLEVKNILYSGNYISYYTKSWMNEKIPREYRWIGTFTELYIGIKNGQYTKQVADEDKDDIYWKGKFYDINKVYNKLNEYHKNALKLMEI